MRKRPKKAEGSEAQAGADRGPVPVHLGYPKAASTWLQQEVFSAPGSGLCTPWDRLAFISPGRCAAARGWTDPGADAAAAAGAVARGREQAAAAGCSAVLSEETLVGYLGDPGVDADRLGRLAALAPDARYLLCVREPAGMARSAHGQQVLDGGTCGPGFFLGDPGAEPTGRDHRRLHRPYLDASAVAAALPPGSPLEVIDAGWLRTDPRRLHAALARWAGRPLPGFDARRRVNRSPGPAGTELLRRLNAVWPRRGPWEPRSPATRRRLALLADAAAERLTPRRCERLRHELHQAANHFAAGTDNGTQEREPAPPQAAC